MRNYPRRTSHAASQRLRQLARGQLARDERGMSIIEVVMSAVIIVLIAGGVLTGIDAAGRSSADLRHRSQAQELAQQDQERMRGISSQQLSGLNETREVTVDGTVFTITSTGQFLQHADGGTSCGGESADYIKVVSEIDWQPLNKRPPVVVQSIITPPIGGTLLARVTDHAGEGVPGAKVTVTGPENFTATTDAAGCVILAAMDVGDYVVTASKTGYVNWDGESEVSDDAHVSTSETAIPLLEPLGEAGAINASFSTRVQGAGSPCDSPIAPAPNYCTGQFARSMSWVNPGAYNGFFQTRNSTDANGSDTIRTPATGFNLFPFAVGGDTTNNWTVWGGSCDLAKPPQADRSFATVNPRAEAAPLVRLPALIIKVTYAGTHVTPNRIGLRDACDQVWNPALRPGPPVTTAGSAYNALGTLNYPGQPYAPAGNPYDVCVEYDPPGAVTTRRVQPTTANANFTAGTALNVALTSSSTTAPCQF